MFPVFSAFRRESLPLALMLASVTCAVAGPGTTAITDLGQTEQYFFDSYNVESGLPGVAVNGVCQTRDGFLWIATGGGLARFDGVRFTSFRPTDTPAFQSPLIYRLLETRDGTLWIGTARGLVTYRNQTFERAGLENAEVHSLVEDRSGRLWIGTFGQGLYVREHGHYRAVEAPALSGARYIFRLLLDQAGKVWISTDLGGVACADGDEVKRVAFTEPFPSVVEAMCEQPAGTLWLGTRADGLYRLRNGVLTHVDRAEGLATRTVSDLLPSSDGGIWIASGTLQRLADPDHPQVTTIPDVPRQPVFSLFEDREGSLWVAAKERGFMRGGSMPYRLISPREGVPDGIRSIVEDPAHNLWLGSKGMGVVKIAPDGTMSTPLAEPNGSPGPIPTVVLAARDGAIWIGTAGVLYVWRGGRLQPVPEMRAVYGLFEDSAGAIWIGTVNDGIFRYQDGRFTPTPLRSGAPVPHATGFCEGPDHTVYAATWISGFAAIKDGRATLFTRADGLPTDEVRVVYADADNRIWLGFRGHGIGLWQNNHCWSSATLAEALFNHVSAITEDAQNVLWLGTPAGVMWVPKSDLLAAAQGEKTVAELRIAQVNRSLRTASVWTGPQSVVCVTHDQKLLFATREGILALDPRRVPGRSVPPPVYVEHVSVDGHRLESDGRVVLAAGAKNLVIDYTAPSFIEPGQVFFKYRLDGFDADWIEAKARRTVSYGNLGPGRYVFHVTACNADGAWNPVGAELVIQQRPHFYQTKWFFLLVGLSAVGAAIGFNRWSHYRLTLRLERLEARQATERERRRIAKNLHDDLGANLTELSLFAESIQQKVATPELDADMTALSERMRNLAGTLDAIVWSANPANDSLDRLALFVCGLFQDLCRMAGIRCRIDLPAPLPPSPLTPDERSNLFLAAREAMTNLARHSHATEAWLRMKMEDDGFQFTLEDNGCGFDFAAATAGNRNGLGNIRARITELHGTAEFDTAPGRGTKVILRVPLKT